MPYNQKTPSIGKSNGRRNSYRKLSQFVEILGQFKQDFFLAIVFLDNDAGNADTAAGLDGIKLGTVVTILEELLEGQHTAGNIDISELDVSLGKSLFHRGTAGSMHAGVHYDLFHIFLSFFIESFNG